MIVIGGKVTTRQRVAMDETGVEKHIYLCVQGPGKERFMVIMDPEQALEVAAGLMAEATSIPQVLS